MRRRNVFIILFSTRSVQDFFLLSQEWTVSKTAPSNFYFEKSLSLWRRKCIISLQATPFAVSRTQKENHKLQREKRPSPIKACGLTVTGWSFINSDRWNKWVGLLGGFCWVCLEFSFHLFHFDPAVVNSVPFINNKLKFLLHKVNYPERKLVVLFSFISGDTKISPVSFSFNLHHISSVLMHTSTKVKITNAVILTNPPKWCSPVSLGGSFALKLHPLLLSLQLPW